MTDKGRPEDDEDERETIAGDTAAPRGEPTDADADFVSLPPRPFPKRPPPAGPRTPAPDPDEVPTGEVPALEPTVVESSSPTEVPTREVDVEREMPTIVGSFAASQGAEATAVPPEEAETIVEPGSQSAGPSPTPGTSQPARPPAYRSPLGKGTSRTARDPIVGTAASRGTTPGGASVGPAKLAEGQLLADRYELIERLGKGGMGEVWKARHTLLQGERAIKVIKASISKDPSFRQRFLQEGQTMMRVKHEGVVEVTDLDETRQNRELFMVMEYLKGRTIYDAVRSKDKTLAANVRDAVRILREVADGMQRIHDERIVHKDLKTDNVLLVVGDDGLEHPKVIDFGLAKRLGDKDVVPVEAASPSPGVMDSDLHTTLSGTLAYMAPEQFRHEASSFQSDVYAFGVMAYEVFTKGEYPVPRGPLQHYLELHTRGTQAGRLGQKRPDLDPKLTAIFDRCIETDKAKRPESFRDVAGQLQFWLDTPERLARRRRIALMSTGVAAIALFGLWAYFFGGEKTASLSNPTIAVGGLAVPPAQVVGDTVYLRGGDSLAAFEVTAKVSGETGEAYLEVDDSSRPVKTSMREGLYVAAANLADVPDGRHKFALRASRRAAPVDLFLEVDRVAPAIRTVTVRGGQTDAAGAIFSNSEAPEVVVELDEAADRIASVAARPLAGGAPVAAQRDGERWLLLGTAAEDGRVEFDVVSRDRAGNESSSRFAYVRDTGNPEVTMTDQYSADEDVAEGVRVRSATGEKLRVAVKDAFPCTVAVAFGGAAPVTAQTDGRSTVEFDVPPVGGGVATVLTVRDAAGNTVPKEFTIREASDELVVTDGEGLPRRCAEPDTMQRLVLLGHYQVGDSFKVTATQVRDAAGNAIVNPESKTFGYRVVDKQREGRIVVLLYSTSAFAEGAHRIDVTTGGPTRVKPYELVVDAAPPIIESWTVAEKSPARDVPENGFALSRDLVVRATVADLSPERLTLGGVKPKEPLEPGRHTYTFEVTCPHEGVNTWPLSVSDGVKRSDQKSLTVRADWETPAFALTSPDATSELRDDAATKFAGRCANETDYDVKVRLPDGDVKAASFTAADFDMPVVLPGADAPVPVSVWAEDRAGHRSETIALQLRVRRVLRDLPPQIQWAQGVTVQMEQVAPGDVVIGGHVRPVQRSFVDRCEVTNREYRAFLDATKGGHGAWCAKDEPKNWDHTPAAATWKDAKWNGDDLPVVNVAWWDAYAFAEWSGRRLPTEAEWVKAAAKSLAPGETELRMWPPFAAGEEWKNGVVVTSDWAKGPASALTGGDVSPVGCLHMGGNVSEWVELPEAIEGSTAGTRGGSWFFSRRAADVRDTPAKAWDRSFRANTIGFRCALDAAQVRP